MAVAEPGPLHVLSDDQRNASDPAGHVWLSASAGTGKTQVLAARVFRLLLRGVDPAAILCLTFTKAGAAEMAARISDRLAQWVRMPANALAKDLTALGEDNRADRIALARTLFARVLDAAGGGLRIQTIHGFCQSLLAGFPLEAGLVPGFWPLEAREEAQLAREALAGLLIAADARGDRATVATIGDLSLRLGEGGAESFLLACAKSIDALEALPAGIAPWLKRALHLPDRDIEEEIADCCGDDGFDLAGLQRIAAANAGWGTATGLAHADIAARWLAATGAERAALLGELVGVAHTAKGEPRSWSKKLIEREPDYGDFATRLGSRCAELLALRVRAGYADLLARGLTAGRDYARGYAEAKRRIGGVDFDDLIRATVRLLQTPGMGDWVRYKLDQATDHILIDEAQDTNAEQWAIVRALADEFFAGEGAKGSRERTLFTVGDHKQAIFGFQGTSPIFFAAAQKHFATRAEDAMRAKEFAQDDALVALPMRELALANSYRSTRPVLEFVDTALGIVPVPGLGLPQDDPHRSEIRGPGSVMLWPATLAGGDPEDEEGWVDDATREHATRIARRVRDWLAAPLIIDGKPLQPQDVMILVKRRGDLAALIVARLHAEGVAVAGVDRLRLNAPLAVQDLLAAIRFVLQPDDDLVLASLLVSPLIGWSQDRLYEAGRREEGVRLWRHLRATQPDDVLAPLTRLLARADFSTPYRFLEDILSGPLDGRRKLVRRLGGQARDPIGELLNAALNFEDIATPSLQIFLDWFDRGDVEIVRDPSQPLDAVRVMTAHGAKGLQAPLVILADATADPASARREVVRWPVTDPDVTLPIFRPRKIERSGPLAAAMTEYEQRELEEHWRLFYVAMTRAERMLVIAGALGPGARGVIPPASWYAVAAAAMAALGVAGEDDGDLIFEGLRPEKAARASTRAKAVAGGTGPLPEWLHQPAPAEARPPRPLAPSSLGDDDVADPPPTPAMRAGAARGRLLHALFERLPPVAPERRGAAADRWLREQGGVGDEDARAALVRAALAVIEAPDLAALFSPEAIAEAPIAAVVNGVVVAGTVDRLLVTDRCVRIVDFKTGRLVPERPDSVPRYHLRQMAAYAAALGMIFPGRPIAAALLYAAGPKLIMLPDDLLAVHKPGLAAAEQS